MQTNKIEVDKSGRGREEVLNETSKFALYNELDKKTSFHLRLLAEETLGMINAITEDFKALFWLETTGENTCLLHLTVHTDMDYEKKQHFMDVSANHENMAARGFMAKIGEMIKDALFNLNEYANIQTEYGGPLLYGSMGMGDIESINTNSMIYMWSMKRYQDGLSESREEDQEASEAWDELEKSIVASIADDVLVGIRGDEVELIIEKKL